MTKSKHEKIKTLINEATVDCYTDEEFDQAVIISIEENLEFPFEARVIDQLVKVIGVNQIGSQLKAVCVYEDKKYQIDLMDLELDTGEVNKGIWIDVYVYWKLK